MKLYFYELYKLLSNRIFVFLFVLVFSVNISAFILTQNLENTETKTDFNRSEYSAVLHDYRNMPVDKAIDDATENYKIYSMCRKISNIISNNDIKPDDLELILDDLKTSDPDIFKLAYEIIQSGSDDNGKAELYKQAVEQLSYIKKYDSFIDEMEQRADKMLTFSVFADKDSFSMNNIQQTPKDFEHLKGIKLIPADYTGVEKGTSFYITDFLVIALIFMMCICFFSLEREKSLIILIKSTKNGHFSAAASKLTAFLTCVAVTCILFYGSDIVSSFCIYGLGELSAPIQSISSFMDCNLKINVLQYLLLWNGCKILTAVTFGFIFAAVFMLIKNSAIIYSVCAAITVAEYLLFAFVMSQSPINHFKYINLMYFLDSRKLLRNYLNLNFFNIPINIFPIYLTLSTALIILSTFIFVFAFSNQRQIASGNILSVITEKIRQRFLRNRGNVSIFFAEGYKLLIQQKVWIILVLLLCIGISNSYRTYNDSFVSISEATYHSYMQTLEGKLDSDKKRFIEEEKTYYENVFKEYNALSMLEEKSIEQQSREESLQFIIDNKYKGFKMFMDHYDYLQQKHTSNSTGIYFIDDLKYGHIFSSSKNDWQNFTICLAAMIVALGNIFAFEHKKNMTGLLRSTPGGKYRLCMIKYIISGLTTAVIFIAAYSPDFIVYFRQYGSIIGEAPAYSMEVFSEAPAGLSLSGLLILMYALRFIILLCVAVFIASLSELTENYFLTMIISTMLFIFSAVLFLNQKYNYKKQVQKWN